MMQSAGASPAAIWMETGKRNGITFAVMWRFRRAYNRGNTIEDFVEDGIDFFSCSYFVKNITLTVKDNESKMWNMASLLKNSMIAALPWRITPSSPSGIVFTWFIWKTAILR